MAKTTYKLEKKAFMSYVYINENNIIKYVLYFRAFSESAGGGSRVKIGIIGGGGAPGLMGGWFSQSKYNI